MFLFSVSKSFIRRLNSEVSRLENKEIEGYANFKRHKKYLIQSLAYMHARTRYHLKVHGRMNRKRASDRDSKANEKGPWKQYSPSQQIINFFGLFNVKGSLFAMFAFRESLGKQWSVLLLWPSELLVESSKLKYVVRQKAGAQLPSHKGTM